ncbi:MAG: shikimate dehydrogenase [Chitinivibrionales bacterium]|nr:shikimate dehydrogenase [Chitinivibrionales bacterium]
MDAQLISGNTRLIGLLGNPVAHSISPLIHNHALRRLCLPFAYIPLGVPTSELHSVIHSMRVLGFAGANVTVPHKQQVLHYCDAVSDLSQKIGAVNTLYVRDRVLHGTTTDAQGFFRALSWMGHDARNGSIVILGNGGTARTLGYAFAIKAQCAALTLIGRKQERVGTLAEEISRTTGFKVAWALFSSASLPAILEKCTLLINCTPVGMHPHKGTAPLDQSQLHTGITVFDAIYSPLETKLLASAKAAGCATQNGLRMLLYQALASFTCWTGVEAPDTLFDIHELERQITGT